MQAPRPAFLNPRPSARSNAPQPTVAALWRPPFNDPVPEHLNQLRVRLLGASSSADSAQALSGYLETLQNANFNDLRVQQEIHPILPWLLEQIQNSPTEPSLARAALHVLTVLQERVAADPDLEHLYWVRVLYCLGSHVANGRALPPDFHRMRRGTPNAEAAAVLRDYFLAPETPEGMRGLALLTWSSLGLSNGADRAQSSLGPPLLRLAEDPSRDYFVRQLALQAYFEIPPGPRLGVLDRNQVERDFLSLLQESPVPDPAWRCSLETFSRILRHGTLGDRAFFRFFNHADRILEHGALSASESRDLLAARAEVEAFLEELRPNTISPQKIQARQIHLAALFRLMSHPSNGHLRILAFAEYASNVHWFQQEASYLGNRGLALPEVHRGIGRMQQVLNNPSSDERLLEIAGGGLGRLVPHLSEEDQRRLELWLREQRGHSGLSDFARLQLYRIERVGAKRRHDDVALRRIENDLVDLILREPSPSSVWLAVDTYSSLLEDGSPAPHREQVVDRLILRIQAADESEEAKLAILHLFRILILHRNGESSSPDRVLIACQNVLQNSGLSEHLRTWAFTNCIMALRRHPANDPDRTAFLAILQALARNDPSIRMRENAREALGPSF